MDFRVHTPHLYGSFWTLRACARTRAHGLSRNIAYLHRTQSPLRIRAARAVICRYGRRWYRWRGSLSAPTAVRISVRAALCSPPTTPIARVSTRPLHRRPWSSGLSSVGHPTAHAHALATHIVGCMGMWGLRPVYLSRTRQLHNRGVRPRAVGFPQSFSAVYFHLAALTGSAPLRCASSSPARLNLAHPARSVIAARRSASLHSSSPSPRLRKDCSSAPRVRS